MKTRFLKKYNVQIGTSIAMLVFGALLSLAGFIVDPMGIVSDNVVDIFSRCLFYAGSMLSVGAYVNARFDELDRHFKVHGRKEDAA